VNDATSPVGLTIVRLGGLLESRTERPRIEGYTAVLEFAGSRIFLMSSTDIVPVEEWPEDAGTIPFQSVEVEGSPEGSRVTAAVRVRRGRGENAQLFLVLDKVYILGLVNSAMGTVLHAEALLSAPTLRPPAELQDLAGRSVTLEELVGVT